MNREMRRMNEKEARHLNGANVPLIGQPKPKVGVGLMALVYDLDENGMMEPEHVKTTPQGVKVAPGRTQLVSVKDLLVMIRDVVREELKAHDAEPVLRME